MKIKSYLLAFFIHHCSETNFSLKQIWQWWLKKGFDWSVSLYYFDYRIYFYKVENIKCMRRYFANNKCPRPGKVIWSYSFFHSAPSIFFSLPFLEHASLRFTLAIHFAWKAFLPATKMLTHLPHSSLDHMSPSWWAVLWSFYLNCTQLPTVPTQSFLSSSIPSTAHILTYYIT